MWSSTRYIALLATIIPFIEAIHSKQDSFSFFKFSGPLSGEVEEIFVSDGNNPHNGDRKIDYIARPDYLFHYGVQDKKTGNSQGHKESRDGDVVKGEYRVLQDNGLVRIVSYTADPEKGFQAQIEYAKLKQ